MIPPASPHRCFAASNSCHGFKNYYGDIFTDARVDRLFIIKGGPGTGKSHFMKTVARCARAHGYTVTEYLCSSDPTSLDGILLCKEGTPTVGLLDGTAPHVREPSTPGAHDEIINLGEFWNAKPLVGQRETIRALGRAKSAAYDRAYAYLRAAGDTDAVADSLTESCVRHDSLRALANRILRHQPVGDCFDPMPALRSAVSMTGAVTLRSFEESPGVSTLITMEDYYGLGYRLTRELLSLSEVRRHRLRVSYHPVYPHKIDGLLYPDTGLCILVGHTEPPADLPTRTLSLRRYVEPEILRPIRGELRRAITLRESLLEAALHSLSDASVHHFELEKIYSAAMDFGAKEGFTERFCNDLFVTE